MDKVHPIIRWIIFIPASLLAGLVSYYSLILLSLIKPLGGLVDYFIPISSSGLSAAAAVYIGVLIAPSFKKRVIIGYVLVTLLLIPLTLIFTPILQEGIFENLKYIAQDIGIFGMAWYLYKKETEEQ